MSEYIYFVISMAVSGSIFMALSIKRNWSVLFWEIVNKRVSSTWNVSLFVLGSAILQLIILLSVGRFIDNPIVIKSIAGIVMGMAFALIPNLSKKK
jgi:hypothetical protein